MDVGTLSQLVSNLGFPIFVAGFMLLKQSKDTETMTLVLNEVKTAIQHLSEKGGGSE